MRKLTYEMGEGPAVTIEKIMQMKMGLTRREIRHARYQENGILVDGIRKRTNQLLEKGQRLVVSLTEESSGKFVVDREPVQIWYEDQDMLLVEKPAGAVVHPSHGHYSDSMENRLAGYYEEKKLQEGIHIVGRLDKDTSGILMVAKSRAAAGRLAEQRKQGRAIRTYLALVEGHFTEKELAQCFRDPESSDSPYVIEEPIGKKEGTLNQQEVKPGAIEPQLQARTSFWIEREYRQKNQHQEDSGHTLVRVQIQTGRTHQIRVHMAWLGHPLLGDPIYGTEKMVRGDSSYETGNIEHGDSTYGATGLTRAALHSARMECTSPFTGERICIESPLPEDMRFIIDFWNRYVYTELE